MSTRVLPPDPPVQLTQKSVRYIPSPTVSTPLHHILNRLNYVGRFVAGDDISNVGSGEDLKKSISALTAQIEALCPIEFLNKFLSLEKTFDTAAATDQTAGQRIFLTEKDDAVTSMATSLQLLKDLEKFAEPIPIADLPKFSENLDSNCSRLDVLEQDVGLFHRELDSFVESYNLMTSEVSRKCLEWNSKLDEWEALVAEESARV